MPKIVDHEQKRAEMIAAARAVIADRGLSDATMRRVAREAGCTTGAVTHYFRDQRELLVAALRSAHEAAGARMAALEKDTLHPARRLRAIVREALPLDDTRLREWKVWLAFWNAALFDAALRRENARRDGEWLRLLERSLASLGASPSARRSRARALAALVDGLGLRVALHAGDARSLAMERDAATRAIDAWVAR